MQCLRGLSDFRVLHRDVPLCSSCRSSHLGPAYAHEWGSPVFSTFTRQGNGTRSGDISSPEGLGDSCGRLDPPSWWFGHGQNRTLSQSRTPPAGQRSTKINAFRSAMVNLHSSSVSSRPDPYFRSSPRMASCKSAGSCSVENTVHGSPSVGIDTPVLRSITRTSCRVMSLPLMQVGVTSNTSAMTTGPFGYLAWNKSPARSLSSATLSLFIGGP